MFQKKHNQYEFFEDCVFVYPQDDKNLYTILDYEGYELLKDKYLYPKSDRNNGYYWCFRDGKKSTIRVHAILCCSGCDHINGNKSDNRMCNLRKASSSQNSYNRGATKRNTTGYKGVQFDKKTNSFMVQLRYNNHLLYLGNFETAEDAAKQYDRAAIKYFGEFAWTNFNRENYNVSECMKIEPSTMKNRQRSYKKKGE